MGDKGETILQLEAVVITSRNEWCPRPELNWDQRFRKPLLYPFELRGHRSDLKIAAFISIDKPMVNGLYDTHRDGENRPPAIQNYLGPNRKRKKTVTTFFRRTSLGKCRNLMTSRS
jgi:hypothetical protein